MKREQAIKLAIEAMRAQLQRLAVDANMCDVYGATYQAAVGASAKRKQVLEAIEILDQEVNNGNKRSMERVV